MSDKCEYRVTRGSDLIAELTLPTADDIPVLHAALSARAEGPVVVRRKVDGRWKHHASFRQWGGEG